MRQFIKFQSLFLPTRYLQGLKNNIIRNSGGFLIRQWVVSRGLCLYRVFFLKEIPQNERKKALNIRIKQWSPFRETGEYIILDDEIAHVWIWDKKKQQDLVKNSKTTSPDVFPETVLRSRPETDLLRIIRCIDGFEAQIWKQGVVVSSHWWDEMPCANEWRWFLLENDLNPETEKPAAEDVCFLNRPWRKKSYSNTSQLLSFNEKKWIALAMSAFSFILFWQGVELWKWNQSMKSIEAQIQKLDQKTEPIIKTRSQAIQYRQNIELLSFILAFPPQMHLMAEVTKQLPKEGVILIQWQYNQDHLMFILEGKTLNPRYYVEIYEKLPYFLEVTAQRGQIPNQLIIEMRVAKKQKK